MFRAEAVATIAAGFLRDGPCCEKGYCQTQIEEAVHLAARVTEAVRELYPDLVRADVVKEAVVQTLVRALCEGRVTATEVVSETRRAAGA